MSLFDCYSPFLQRLLSKAADGIELRHYRHTGIRQTHLTYVILETVPVAAAASVTEQEWRYIVHTKCRCLSSERCSDAVIIRQQINSCTRSRNTLWTRRGYGIISPETSLGAKRTECRCSLTDSWPQLFDNTSNYMTVYRPLGLLQLVGLLLLILSYSSQEPWF